MSSAFDETRFFQMIPHIPVDSLGRKVLKLDTKTKLQAAQFNSTTVAELEEQMILLEKSGFWTREPDGETFVINPKYCKPDFKNLERLEDDNRKQRTVTETSTEE